MKQQTKMLIVVAILVLSAGPVLNFFNTSEQTLDLPEDQDSGPVYYLLSGNITTSVLELDPYMSYAGISAQNNQEYVEQVLDSIGDIDEYTVEVSLNPMGEGYKYVINVALNNESDSKAIGFRMAYRFLNFFDQERGVLPTRIAYVQIPSEFNTVKDNETVTVRTSNETISVAVLYSTMENDSVVAMCPEFQTSLRYKLARFTSNCYDAQLFEEQPFLGLVGMDAYMMDMATARANVSIRSIEGTVFSGNYTEGMDMNTTFNSLSHAGEGQFSELENGTGTYSVLFDAVAADDVASYQAELESFGLTVDDYYDLATVWAPDTFNVGGKIYEPFQFPYAEIYLEPGHRVNSVIGVTFIISLKYDEVVYLQAELAEA